MGEFRRKAFGVEAFTAGAIVRSPENDWSAFPAWLSDIYANGQMVIAKDGVTLLTGREDAKAMLDDYIVREPDGTVAVYDQATFDREFERVEKDPELPLEAA